MSKKVPIRLILNLKDAGLSRRKIAQTRSISRELVSRIFNIADEKNITYASSQSLSDTELALLFYPKKTTNDSLYLFPDYALVHKELKRVGVTLKLLWQEYLLQFHEAKGQTVGYSRFCEGYRQYVNQNEITNHIYHKPGYRCEVDWAGQTMHYIDKDTSEKIKVYLFVATLPYSQYSYCEPTLNMKQNTWLECHINLYDFFKGVPVITVCDNLKTGVIQHPKEGEIVLNRDYESLANHYHTAIMPAGVGKPKQKPSVEGTVGKITTAIIARFRNTVFTSFTELKQAVSDALNQFNQAPFQKRQGSRESIFLEEQKILQPLPQYPYEVCEWKHGLMVGKNCHITFRNNFYSCPYSYRGKEVDIKVSNSLLKIYQHNQLLTSHPLFAGYIKNRYSTHKEDLPSEFTKAPKDHQFMLKQAEEIGPYTRMVVKKLFESVSFKEQAYNPVKSILGLGKTYGYEHLEAACQRALSHLPDQTIRYPILRSIISSMKLKRISTDERTSTEFDQNGYIRGSAYYKEQL